MSDHMMSPASFYLKARNFFFVSSCVLHLCNALQRFAMLRRASYSQILEHYSVREHFSALVVRSNTNTIVDYRCFYLLLSRFHTEIQSGAII